MVAYSFLLLVGLVLSSPWWLVRMITTEKYREGMRERLGLGTARIHSVVTGKRVAWIHAVSVGEVLAASRLVIELSEALGPEWAVVISTTTRTGQTLARERFGAERVFYLPLDFAWAIRAWMRVLKPRVLVLMESEIWPRLLWECKRLGAPTVVVNARVSDRSFARALKVRSLWGNVLRMVTLWLAQSEEDARRLREMGATEVRVAGNLKFDVRAPQENLLKKRIEWFLMRSRLIVAGSTLEGEEKLILEAWPMLSESIPDLVLMIAPRHPERFQEVIDTVRQLRYATYPCSSLVDVAEPLFPGSVLILNTVGDLAAMYGLASIAVVGGSLVKRGGHNPLEPAQFGVPVVIGPSFENFRGIVDSMRAVNAISIVGQSADPSVSLQKSHTSLAAELAAEVRRLLTNPDEAKAMGKRGRQVFEAEQGATARAVEAIVALVQR